MRGTSTPSRSNIGNAVFGAEDEVIVKKKTEESSFAPPLPGRNALLHVDPVVCTTGYIPMAPPAPE